MSSTPHIGIGDKAKRTWGLLCAEMELPKFPEQQVLHLIVEWGVKTGVKVTVVVRADVGGVMFDATRTWKTSDIHKYDNFQEQINLFNKLNALLAEFVVMRDLGMDDQLLTEAIMEFHHDDVSQFGIKGFLVFKENEETKIA